MNGFLDYLMETYKLKNDAALARFMEVSPPVVSKWRYGTLPFGALYILRAHELTDMPIKEIKARLRDE
jgi:hypothetical protein